MQLLLFWKHLGYSLLQNGNVPKFIGEVGLSQIFEVETPSPCYKEIRQAFTEFGIFQVRVTFDYFV